MRAPVSRSRPLSGWSTGALVLDDASVGSLGLDREFAFGGAHQLVGRPDAGAAAGVLGRRRRRGWRPRCRRTPSVNFGGSPRSSRPPFVLRDRYSLDCATRRHRQLAGTHSVTGFTAGLPLEMVKDRPIPLVALGMNGEPLTVRNGFPARLLTPGIWGADANTKWLAAIELTTWIRASDYWDARGWPRTPGTVKPGSRIDLPRIARCSSPDRPSLQGFPGPRETELRGLRWRSMAVPGRQHSCRRTPARCCGGNGR